MTNTCRLLSLLPFFTACAAADAPEDDFSELAGLNEKSDAFSNKLRILGSLQYGQDKAALHSGTPRYRGYTINAASGDLFSVSVSSEDGDPIAWLLDENFKIMMKNDDAADGDTTSIIDAEVTTGGLLYLVFRETTDERANFVTKIRGATLSDPPLCELAFDKTTMKLGEEAVIDFLQESAVTCELHVDGVKQREFDCNTTGRIRLLANVLGVGDHTIAVKLKNQIGLEGSCEGPLAVTM